MPLEMLIKEAEGMTDDALMEVIHYMQFLKLSSGNMIAVTCASTSDKDKKVYRTPGLYKGKIKMLEGFDNPLDDFEEYM